MEANAGASWLKGISDEYSLQLLHLFLRGSWASFSLVDFEAVWLYTSMCYWLFTKLGRASVFCVLTCGYDVPIFLSCVDIFRA